MSCSNGVVPLELPLNNVTVSSDGRVVGRGVEFGLGTPQQIVSLQVGLNERDLFVGNAAGCNDTEGKCMARFAGIYDSSESDTYDRVTQSQWNGTSEDELFAASGASFIFFNEHVQYGSNGSADAFPVYMAEVDTNSTRQGGLPLASNSTFLSSAYDNGFAPSSAYGLYYGSRSVEYPADGLLVVGGYDAGRIDGNLTDLPYNPQRPASFEIESMVYETEQGSDSLLDGPLTAYLESFIEVISIPQEAWEKFRDASGGEYNPELGMLVMPPDARLGNMTVKLSNGFETTIPSHELFTKRRKTDDDGQIYIDNPEETISVVFNATSFDDQIGAIWGYPFLAQNYLFMDHIRQEFKIGKARTEIGMMRGSILDGSLIEKQIETVCAPDDEASGGGGSGSKAGAIAGGVVGGVVGVALVAFAVWFFLRRKRAKAAAGSSEKQSPTELGQPLPPAYQENKDTHPKAADMGSLVEMSPEGDPRYSMSELDSPEQARGSGFGAQQQKPLELPASLPEEKTVQKGPVELP